MPKFRSSRARKFTSLTDVQRAYIACLSEGKENALSAKDVAMLKETTNQAAYAMLGDLHAAGRIERIGGGGRWDPYRYFKITSNSIPTTPTPTPTPILTQEVTTDPFPEMETLMAKFKAVLIERDKYKNEVSELKEVVNDLESKAYAMIDRISTK